MRRSLHGWLTRRRPWSFARPHGILAAALLSATASHAHADTTPLPVHVVVEAPASCTNEEKFWAEVAKRTAELRRVPADAGAPTLLVRAWKEKDSARGELSLRTVRGEMLPARGVVARTCGEVIAALALALVLAMEEGALTSEPTPLKPAELGSKPAQALPSPAPARPPASIHRDVVVEPPRRVATSMGAHVLLVGVAGLASGLGIFSELRPPYLGGHLFFRLEGAAWRRTVTRVAGEAELTWAVLRASVCVREALGVFFALCGLVDGGAFTASATQARNPLSYSAPWGGAGLAVGAAWNASAWLGIEAEAGILAPFARDELILRPNALLFSTPAVVTWAGIGPVLHFR